MTLSIHERPVDNQASFLNLVDTEMRAIKKMYLGGSVELAQATLNRLDNLVDHYGTTAIILDRKELKNPALFYAKRYFTKRFNPEKSAPSREMTTFLRTREPSPFEVIKGNKPVELKNVSGG